VTTPRFTSLHFGFASMAITAATAAAAATPHPWQADASPRRHAACPALRGRRRLPVVRCQSSSVDDKPKSKRGLLDNASNLLTNLLSGGSLGAMPVAEGAVTDLFGRPLFFSLYDWFLEVITPINLWLLH
jgi:hypothetical protein